MTHQFKFGDRVQDTEGRQFIFLRGYLSCCTVASSDGKTHDYLLDKIYPCATEPHPDTVRLDYLLFNEYVYLIGRYGKRYGIGRDEIDADMRKQAAKAV